MADQLTDKETREIWCLVQLREALGDPLGKLMQDELVQLARDVVAERDRLRKDAERYRWLRDNGTSEWGICVWGDDDQEWAQDIRAADVVDREIDAAMELHNAKLTGEAAGEV